MAELSLVDILGKGKEQEARKEGGEPKIKVVTEDGLFNTSGKIREVLNYPINSYPVRAAWTLNMKSIENTCEMYLRGYVNPSDAGVDDKFVSISQLMLLGQSILPMIDNGTVDPKSILSKLDPEQLKTLETEVVVRQQYTMLGEEENKELLDQMMLYTLFDRPFKVDKALQKGNMFTVATVRHEEVRKLIVDELWDTTIEILDNKNLHDNIAFKYVLTEPNVYLESKIEEILPKDRQYLRGTTKAITSDEIGSKPSILAKMESMRR